MSLSRYWPTRDEVNRCIKAEAESASDAVLLAAHQPMRLLRRDEGSGVESQVSEHDLLEAFLSDDLPQGTLLMPIMGASGAGKSHLIRWLAAQLGRDPRARHMHVIRIPKSASLRGVVELVLEPLSNDDRFSDIRESLGQSHCPGYPTRGCRTVLGRAGSRSERPKRSSPGRTKKELTGTRE